MRIISLLILTFIFDFEIARAEVVPDSTQEAPKIFIDCDNCWKDFLKDNFKFLNFVRIREDSDIYIQVLDNHTASNGTEYILDFIGMNRLNGIRDTIKFISDLTMSSDDSRNMMLKYIKIGLVSFISKTTLIDNITVSYAINETNSGVVEIDNWNNWMFSLSGHGYLSGQNTNRNLSFWGSLSAKRLTERFKTRISIGNNYSEDAFNYSEVHVTSISRSFYGDANAVWSIGNNFALGSWIDISNSSYSNIDIGVSAGPGIEYNFYPYSDYARRELRINYSMEMNYKNYHDTTIYDKLWETYLDHSLSATFELIQPWGEFSLTLSGNALLKDISKNRLSLNTGVSINVFKGLSLDFSFSYSTIHNQLNIAKGDATLDEILLKRRQLESNFNYWGSFGISYSFGSIYNNIVNTRFGG